MSLRQLGQSNQIYGTVVANGATPVVVPATGVNASSMIILTPLTTGGANPRSAYVSARVASTSFSITSLAGDNGSYNYLVVNFV